MKYTLKTKKIQIWVTEVVCNLLMNNLTTNKFKQLKSSVTEEHTVCAVSWPSIHCLHNLFTTSLEKSLSWLSADCKCLSCSNTTHCTILQFYNSVLGNGFLTCSALFLNKQYSVYSSVSQSAGKHWCLDKLKAHPTLFFLFFFCFSQTHNLASVWRRDPGFHFTLLRATRQVKKLLVLYFFPLRTLGIPLE